MPRFRLAVLALLALAPAAPAQTGLPRVHVLATGGTISNLGESGARRTGNELVQGLPGIEKVAEVTVEQFSNVASSAITLEQWKLLSARVSELYRTRPELSGIVVTHGTDTLEETAYFLDLTVSDCRPVVVTGAMRQANQIGADGPANLFNSIRLAADAKARRVGTVVLLNDEIFRARDVTKGNTSRMDTFEAPDAGPIGVADPDAIAFSREPVDRTCGDRVFPLTPQTALPRVDVVYVSLGTDGALVRAAVAAGARGIVLATAGRGATTPAMREAIREAVDRGVIVVSSNRTGSGRVPVGSAERGAEMGAGDLNPQKARVLLMLALTRTRDPREIRRLFEEF